MTNTITASAPGKIHFLGEHTAVYGKPAILAAINKRCMVELIPSEGNLITITSKNFHKTIKLSYEEVLQISNEAQQQWEIYNETGDVSVLKGAVKNEIMYPVIAIGETLTYFRKSSAQSFHLTIDSEIPLGSGHGSSAAVAVSVVAAVAQLLTGTVDHNVISAIAIHVEQKKHGNPSYGDVGAVVHGGYIWFQKETPEKITIKPLDFSVPEKLSKNLLIIQSGIPEESTGEMVHAVGEFRQKDPELFKQVLDEQEALTNSLLEALKKGDEANFLRIIKEGEKNLETIGVTSESARALIRKIEKTGGAAKVCGAGGKADGSGIILAYHKNKKELEMIAKSMNMSYYSVELGGAGLQIL